MKIDAPAPAAPAPAPAEPISEPADDAGFGDFGGSEEPAPENDDKPFDDEPFDAGVEADEETDPKKYIEQLTGKLGQSLRKYTEEQGQPDFDLEKFAINSLLSATHTAEMDEEDKNDIIKKVNTSGDDGNSENDSDNNGDSGIDNNDNSGDDNNGDSGSGSFDNSNSEEELQEGSFLLDKDQIKKSSIFAPEGSKESEFKHDDNLTVNEKNSIFDKKYLTMKLTETFNDESAEPMVEPQVKPEVKPAPDKVQPNIAPSRKNKPFLPMPEVQPDPKAMNEGVWSGIMKGVKSGSQIGPWSIVAIENNKVVGQDISIDIREAIPAHYEAIKKQFPNAILRIEDNEGRIVWTNRK